MNRELSTTGVRKILEEAGAQHFPSRKAVMCVATQTTSVGPANYWELKFPLYQIKQAIAACAGADQATAISAFEKALAQQMKRRKTA